MNTTSFAPGTEVRFSDAMIADLAAQQVDPIAAAEYFTTRRMTTQNEPRPGRVNVKFFAQGFAQYRTIAARDLVAAA